MRPPRAAWLVLAGCATAVALHAQYVPSGPVVYYDEFLQAEATANIARRASPQPCCGYESDRCVEGGPVMWPLATHVASSLFLIGHGDASTASAQAARAAFNRVASFAAPWAAFVWVLLLVGNAWAAALAGFLYALWPGAIRVQGSGDLAAGTALFLLALMCALEAWRRYPGWAGATATLGCLALTCHARLEMSLVLPWVLWRARDARAGRLPGWALLLVGSVLIVAPLIGLYLEGARVQTEGWTNGVDRSLEYLRRHAPGNLAFLFETDGASPALAVLAAGGLVSRAGRRWWGLALTAAGFFLFISAYHLGSFRRVDGFDGFRYAIPIVVLLLPFVGAAVAAILPARPGLMRSGLLAALVLCVAAPTFLQARRFLALPRLVARLDTQIRNELPDPRWARGDVVVTRSVAFARGVSGATNIVERCSGERAAEAIRTAGERGFYLRSWNDPGPTVLPGLCTTPLSRAGYSPDGKGPWLFQYAPCR